MKKEEILAEIQEQEALINSNIPEEEKEFARGELQELKEKLEKLEGKETPKEEAKVEAKEEKKADNIIEQPLSEIKTEKQAEEHIDKLEAIVENPKVSEEAKVNATEKILQTEEKKEEIATGEVQPEKKVSAKAQKIMNEIADNEALINSDIPTEEKDFAKSEVIRLNAVLAVLQEEEIIPEPKEKKKAGRKKIIKTDIETKIKKPVGRPRTVNKDINEPRVKKKLGRPFKKKAEISKDITERKPKEKAKTLAMFDALKINKLLAKAVGREFNKRGIKFGHAGTEGKFSIYIVSEKQISKAYQIYSEIADDHDVKVKKGETIIKW